ATSGTGGSTHLGGAGGAAGAGGTVTSAGTGGSTGAGGSTGGTGGTSASTCGFASTPTSWTVPSCQYLRGTSSTTQQGGPAYSTLDMNGDGKPDLVIADTLSGCLTVAKTQWLVYLGTGDGFAATPTSWT